MEEALSASRKGKWRSDGNQMPSIIARICKIRGMTWASVIGLFLAFVAGGTPANAQASAILDPFSEMSEIAESDYGFKRGSFIVAPIPFSNPTIDSGLLLGAGYLFTLPGSKPSGLGYGRLQSGNGSSGQAAGVSLNFGEGRWTVFGFGGSAEVFYDLNFGGAELPIRQEGELYALRLERGVSQNLKVGAMLSYLDTSIALDVPIFQQLPEFLRPQAELEIGQITLDAVWDTRDNTFYPTSGTLASLKMTYAEEIDSIFGGRFEIAGETYTKVKLSAATYGKIGRQGVVAIRGQACTSSEGAPFFDSCGVGLSSGLRGFPSTQYISDASASLQGEYRGRISDRLGFVGFAAAGVGGNSLSSLNFDEGGASAGVGLRVRLSKRFQLDYAFDYARNDRGVDYFYISLGQKF